MDWGGLMGCGLTIEGSSVHELLEWAVVEVVP